jgi:hypothetical protein
MGVIVPLDAFFNWLTSSLLKVSYIIFCVDLMDLIETSIQRQSVQGNLN